MPLLSITDARAWDGFVSAQPGAQFTQSWTWGEFRRSRGQSVERLVLTDAQGKWSVAAQCLFIKTRFFGGYWFMPRGPIVRHDLIVSSKDMLAQFFAELESFVFPIKGVFLRCEPPIEEQLGPNLLPSTFQQKHRAYQPACTSLIDLTRSEDELLSRMHEKTRYNLRLAERKGVHVRLASTEKDIDVFMQLNAETASRDHFVSPPSAYMRATHDFLARHGMARIRLAESPSGAVLAGSMEIMYGDTVTYLYGVSSSHERSLMAPYALHWDAIRSAKNEGANFYDFHGVNPEEKTAVSYKASWEGITRFKLGWGGSRVCYLGTWESPRQAFVFALVKLARRVFGE